LFIEGVPKGTEVAGIVDTRKSKKRGLMRLLIDDKMVPYAIINVPLDGIYMGVYFLGKYFYYLFVFFSLHVNMLITSLQLFPLIG
jgi:hypothetical protein